MNTKFKKFITVLLSASIIAIVAPVSGFSAGLENLSAELINESGATVSQDNLTDATKIKVNIPEDFTGKQLVAATYTKDGKLLGAAIQTAQINQNEIPINTTGAEKASVYLFDDFETMSPAASAYSFYKTRFLAKAEESFNIASAIGTQWEENGSVKRDGIHHMPFVHKFGNNIFVSYSQHTDSYDAYPVDGFSISRDNGKTFTEEFDLSNSYFTSMMQRDNGDLWGANYITYHKDSKTVDVKTYVSSDMGKNWEEENATVDFSGTDFEVFSSNTANWSSMSMHRGTFEKDNVWYANMYGRFTVDKSALMRCIVIKSTDEGKTWTYHSTVASGNPLDSEGTPMTVNEGFCEPTMTICADGSWLCAMRINGSQNPLGPIYQSRSYDNGLTWSKPVSLAGVKNTTSIQSADPQLLLMEDGTLALVYGRPHSKIIFSLDGCGYKWDESTIQTLYTETYTPEGRSSSDYQGVCEVSPGRLLVAGDIMQAGHNMNVAGTEFTIWGRFIDVTHRKSTESVISEIVLETDKKYLEKNETAQLSVHALDQDGRLYDISNSEITYSSTDAGVAVSNTGLVTGISDANAAVTVTIDGVTSNEIDFSVGDINNLATLELTLDNEGIAPGKTTQAVAAVKNLFGDELTFEGITITYESGNENIATVNESGVITGIASGMTTITATAAQGDIYASASASILVREGNIVVDSDFDTTDVGTVPLGFEAYPNTNCVSVSNTYAHSGTNSIYLNDAVTNAMSAIRVADPIAATQRTVEFNFYPVNLDAQMLIAFFPTTDFSVEGNRGYVTAVNADGSVTLMNASYNTWVGSIIDAGTVKLNEWNSLKCEIDTKAKTMTITVNDKSATVTNSTYLKAAIASTQGFKISSNSTYSAKTKVYIDDFKMTGVSAEESKPDNIIKNAGFEEGTTDWGGFGTFLTESTKLRRSGNKAVDVNKYDGCPAGYLYQTVEVTPGATYNASAWMRLGEGASRNVYIAAAYILDGQQRYHTIGTKYMSPESWQQVTGTITVPEGITSFDLYIQSYGAPGDTSAISQKFYVDDVYMALAE